MKRVLLIIFTMTLLLACDSAKTGDVYKNHVVGEERNSKNFTYHWITNNGETKAILVNLKGKGKSGPYKLQLILDMDGIIKSIKTVGHPGTYGAKVDGALLCNKEKDIRKGVTLDGTSGATISSKNAKKITQRNRTEILKLIDERLSQ